MAVTSPRGSKERPWHGALNRGTHSCSESTMVCCNHGMHDMNQACTNLRVTGCIMRLKTLRKPRSESPELCSHQGPPSKARVLNREGYKDSSKASLFMGAEDKPL